MEGRLRSAGIDIGTSTTQVVFSDLTYKNTGGFGSVPKIEITGKEILFRGTIHRTPLKKESDGVEQIDGEAVAACIREDFQLAGIRPSDLQTGAVIITGESARKRNAAEVLTAIADMAGDFVAAAAGPDLEGVLAGQGSGAAERSQNQAGIIANIDVGGGTANICLFTEGQVVDTACLNLGGRLVSVEKGLITSVSPVLKPILDEMGMPLSVGQPANPNELRCLADRMAGLLAEGLGLKPASACLAECYTNHGLRTGLVPDYLVFSGGVADCMKGERPLFAYGDIGDLLGEALRRSPWFGGRLLPGRETVNATVVGAGNFSMEVSGSTILYSGVSLPMKNIPVFRISLKTEADIPALADSIEKAIGRFDAGETGQKQMALAFDGLGCPTFRQIEAIAEEFSKALKPWTDLGRLPVLLAEADIGKVLGQALRRRLGPVTPFLCLDGVSCTEGDYVDIGSPLAGGVAVPVVVKTLIFNAQVKTL